MKHAAVNYFACPHCASDMRIAEIHVQETYPERDAEIMEGRLECKNCRAAFAIRGGVPRFVDKGLSLREDVNTGERFFVSWKKFSRFDPRYFQQFFDWVAPVRPEFVAGKAVLEAGCGKGRHTEVLHRAGATTVFAVDIGDTVDIAFQSVGRLPGVNVIQADIANLPLKRCFDYGFSVGVLHHMSNPSVGFAALVSKIVKGGAVSCWVYGRENNGWIVHFVNPIRVHITSRLPGPVLTVVSESLAWPLYMYCQFLARFWSAWQQRMKFLPNVFYQRYLCYIAQFDYTEVLHIVFDHLVTPVAFYLKHDELVDWCARLRLRDAALRWHNENSWSLFANVAEVYDGKDKSYATQHSELSR